MQSFADYDSYVETKIEQEIERPQIPYQESPTKYIPQVPEIEDRTPIYLKYWKDL